MEFNLMDYRKYNFDLDYLSDEELENHYHEIGKYQMRLCCSPNNFAKEKVYIFTTKYGYYLSLVLKYILFKNLIPSEIIYEINPYNENLHIIMFSQKVKQFPRKYILYQLEQKDISGFINSRYELSILHSQETWDYSHSNINKFNETLRKKITYLPIPLIPYRYLIYQNINLYNIPKKTNILFFGSVNYLREQKLGYLNTKLSPRGYRIKVINNLFGPELFTEILNSLIVLNIHNYVNGILETNRLNEVLSCDKLVISEKPDIKIDFYNYSLYSERVVFVDSLDEMVEKIVYYLKNKEKYDEKINVEIKNLNYENKLIDDVKKYMYNNSNTENNEED